MRAIDAPSVAGFRRAMRPQLLALIGRYGALSGGAAGVQKKRGPKSAGVAGRRVRAQGCRETLTDSARPAGHNPRVNQGDDMLTRINHIRGTGLFESAPASPAFTRATLVFGENGRGKSTLAALLRSAIGGESDSIAARRTLGSETAQSASFEVQAEGATATFTLRDGIWSGPWRDLVVFDAQFVARNVYAGQGVSPDQRASLLNFALGETAVEAKTESPRVP